MNPAASPGRTWIIFASERRVPLLAPAATARFFLPGCGVAGLSGLGGAPTSAFHADQQREVDSRCQYTAEWPSRDRVGGDFDSVQVN